MLEEVELLGPVDATTAITLPSLNDSMVPEERR